MIVAPDICFCTLAVRQWYWRINSMHVSMLFLQLTAPIRFTSRISAIWLVGLIHKLWLP